MKALHDEEKMQILINSNFIYNVDTREWLHATRGLRFTHDKLEQMTPTELYTALRRYSVFMGEPRHEVTPAEQAARLQFLAGVARRFSCS